MFMRKKIVFDFLLLLFSSLISIACHQEDDSVRVYYDDLLVNHLDSALVVAESTQVDSLSKEERAYFAIFCAEVKIQKHKKIDNLDELLKAQEFFIQNKDKRNMARCLIELAEYYSAKNNYQEQYSNAREALKISIKINDSYLCGVSHSLLGECYNIATLYKESKEEYQKACDYAKVCGNRRLEALSTFRKGRMEWALDSIEQGMNSMMKGYQLAKEIKDSIIVSEFCTDIASYLLYSWKDRSENERLLKFAKESVRYNQRADNYWGFQVLGKAYALCGKIDSSLVYLTKSIESPKPSIKYASYLALADIELARKNLEKSLEYERLSSAWKDSMELQNMRKDVLVADNEWIITTEQQKQGTLRKYTTFIIIVLVAVVVALLFMRKRMQDSRHLLEERIKEDKEREAMRKEVEQVEAAVADIYAWQKTDIFAKMKRVIQGQKEGLETKEHLSEDDWVSIIEVTDRVYHGISRKWRNEYGMKENDIRFCALVLSPISLFDFQFLYNRSESAAYQRERYILQHRFGITDKDKRLKDVLMEMAQEKK
jgi:tetratricopeptide (TPR) repeat protein